MSLKSSQSSTAYRRAVCVYVAPSATTAQIRCQRPAVRHTRTANGQDSCQLRLPGSFSTKNLNTTLRCYRKSVPNFMSFRGAFNSCVQNHQIFLLAQTITRKNGSIVQLSVYLHATQSPAGVSSWRVIHSLSTTSGDALPRQIVCLRQPNFQLFFHDL